MENKQPIELEVQAPQSLRTEVTPHRRKWGEENKQRIMDALTFKDRDLEDIAFSVVVYVAGPMFFSSLALRNELLLGVFLVVSILLFITSWWIMTVAPESIPLVIARIFLVILGIILGIAL